MIHITVSHDSLRRRHYRADILKRLVQRICTGEGYLEDADLNVTFCDDAFIAELNRTYRKRNCPTDVLSFGYDTPAWPVNASGKGLPRAVLGDIVISLETVERQCGGNRLAMPGEIRLLLSHAVLHLLGYRHDTEKELRRMAAKQEEYLGVGGESIWRHPSPTSRSSK